MVQKLDQGRGLYGFRLYSDPSIEKFGRQDFLRPNRGGRVSSVTSDVEGRVHMDGFAYLDEVDRPADLILLTWETEAQPKPQIIDLIPMVVRQDYYHSSERFRRPEFFNDWHAEVDPAKLPSSSGKLRAWAFDHDAKKVYLLRNAAIITDGKLTRMDEEVPPLDRTKKAKK